MRHWLLIALLTLPGCAPQVIAGNEVGGMVSHAGGLFNRDKAFAVADEHCRQFGKAARVSGTDTSGTAMTFDCVKP